MDHPETDASQQSTSEFSPGVNPSVQTTVIGASLGAGFYFAVGLPLQSFWIGRVVGHPINLLTFIAFGMAISLLVTRAKRITSQHRAFGLGLLGDDEDALVLREDALECRKRLGQLERKDRRLVLVQLLNAGLQRARANWSAEDAGQAVKTQAELVQGQTDSEYSLVRYLAWAIPSIGFIGTVLGIGKAMGAMNILGSDANADPMAAAANHLSMAFDTTFVALVLSLIVMYLLYRVQSKDDVFLVHATDWCMRRFVFRMHIRRQEQL